MCVFITCFYLFSLASAGKNDYVNKTSQNIALNDFQHRQVGNEAAFEQRQGAYRTVDIRALRDYADGSNTPASPTIATRKCTNPHAEPDDDIDDNCKEHGKDHAELADCRDLSYGTTNPTQYVSSTVAKHIYLHMCPKLLCWYITKPCPRKWKIRYQGAFRVTCSDDTGEAYNWHMFLDKLDEDTLYDVQSNVLDSAKTELTLPVIRAHTCQEGKSVTNLIVVAYGLGWVYFIWRRPLENCFSSINYEEKYTIHGKSETFSQPDVGIYKDAYDYYHNIKFHPCPKYPSFFCFIVSENVIPFTKVTFKVKTKRFMGEEGDDGAWITVEFTPDDKGQGFPFCPKKNFFLSLWFLIILIVILLLLLLIAAILIALLYKRKREIERLEDEPDFEEEKIPPSNIFEKVWERLKNFFNELCPKPQKPPPPPPPPPPKPKQKPKPKPKPKPKKKPKPVKKPKAKTPSPTPSPPPPPPAPPKPKKRRRDPRTEGGGRAAAAAIDTKRMASGVGGVRARRRRR